MSHDLTVAVRDALDQRAQALDVRTPPWRELEAGFGRVRRARRRRRVARAGGLVAALALAAGGVQGGVLPYPTWAPAVTIAAAPSALDTGRVRGSLAGDAAFLSSLRQAIADGTAHTESEGTWRVPSPDDVHVIYASDVGSWRVALIEARLRAGLLEGRQQMWFSGPRGAAANQLMNLSGNQPHDEAMSWFEGYPGSDGAGVLVALAARPRAWLLAGPPVYAADGTVTRPTTRLEPRADGVVEHEITTRPETVVTASPATTPHDWQELRSSQVDPLTAAKVPPVFVDGRPVPAEQRALLDDTRWELVGASGLVNPPSAALWAGPMGAWSGAAVAVTAPSGARLVRVQGSAPLPDGTDGTVNKGVATVLPAGRLADVALAWQLADPSQLGDNPPVHHVGALGPVGATSARLVDGSTRLAEVALTDRFGLLPPPGAGHEKARVQFTDADGRVLATVAVLDQRADLPTGLPR